MDWQFIINLIVPILAAVIGKVYSDYIDLKTRFAILESRKPTTTDLSSEIQILREKDHQNETAKALYLQEQAQMKLLQAEHSAEIKAIGQALHSINSALIRIEEKIG